MATIKFTHPWFFTMFAIVAVNGAVAIRLATTAKPMSMVDVKRIAEANGFLTYATENELIGEKDMCLKLVVSLRELSENDVNLLPMADPENPQWSGCVCIMQFRRGMGIHQVWPVPEDVFGDLCFFGDRKLVPTVKSLLATEKRP